MPGVRDDLENMFQMPMGFAVPAKHTEFRSCDAAPLGFFHLELCAGTKRVQRLNKRLAVGARVDKCAHRHISADAGERV